MPTCCLTHPCHCSVGLKSYLMFPVSFPHPHSVPSFVPSFKDLFFCAAYCPGQNLQVPLRGFICMKLPLCSGPQSWPGGPGAAAGTRAEPALCPTALRCKTLSWSISELGADFQKRTFNSVDPHTPSAAFKWC